METIDWAYTYCINHLELDAQHILLAGLSNGGIGVSRAASRNPTRYQALLYISSVMEEDARIGLPEIRLGVFPGSGGPIRLVRLVGQSRAKPVVYFGDPIAAQDAAHLGLIHRVVPRGQAMAGAMDLARRLAGQPALAIQAGKRLMGVAAEADRDTAVGFALEQSHRIFQTDDMLEGVTAFLEKRTPRFRHA